MDVHGQHEHQFLMDNRYHLSYLDASGQESHSLLRQRVSECYTAFVSNHRRYARLVKENEQKTLRMNELKQALEELNKAKLKPNEEA